MRRKAKPGRSSCRTRAIFLALMTGIFAMSGALVWRTASDITQKAGHIRVPSAFTSASCKFNNLSGRSVKCGWITVRRDPFDPARGVYRLAVAVFQGRLKARRKAPVIYIQGGPGAASGLGREGEFVWADIDREWPGLNGRTLIVTDARGTGLSEPNTECSRSFMRTGDSGKLSGAIAQSCVNEIRRRGDDPALLSTPVIAADFIAVRKALGVRKWVILGFSYGTRTGLELLRRDAAAVESAIFSGPVPPNADFRDRRAVMLKRALMRLDRRCRADRACTSKGYAPWRDFIAAVSLRLHDRRRMGQTPSRFIDGVFDWLYTAAGPKVLARALHSAAADSAAHMLRNKRRSSPSPGVEQSNFVYMTINCAEIRGFDSRITVVRARAYAPMIHRFFGEAADADICPHWPVKPRYPFKHDTPRTAVPVLLFAGLFDPVTPPEFASLFIAGLSNARVHYLEGGHGVFERECAQRITSSFIRWRGKASGDCGERRLKPLSDGLSVR